MLMFYMKYVYRDFVEDDYLFFSISYIFEIVEIERSMNIF